MTKHSRIIVLSTFVLGLMINVRAIYANSIKGQDSQQTAHQEKDNPREKSKGEEKLKEKGPVSPQPADTLAFEGEITGGKDNIIIVTDSLKAEHNLTLTEETKVTRGGKKATSADLKMNDSVRVQAKRTGDGTLLALSLDIAGE